jgi:hypothetical protein
MGNAIDRRKFLQLSALSAPLLLSKKGFAKEIPFSTPPHCNFNLGLRHGGKCRGVESIVNQWKCP